MKPCAMACIHVARCPERQACGVQESHGIHFLLRNAEGQLGSKGSSADALLPPCCTGASDDVWTEHIGDSGGAREGAEPGGRHEEAGALP